MLFGKKKDEAGPCCCGERAAESAEKAQAAKTEGAYVKILGSGCARCSALAAAAEEALASLGMNTTVDHVTDFSRIAAYGVMSTPALVAGGRVLSCGRVLKADEIAKLLRADERAAKTQL
ncbi:MAG: thioredoxin family protein [Oscillospiraceae bacterium]|nr:thioredoxin family protein [Oscillospiraceae bacterium]